GLALRPGVLRPEPALLSAGDLEDGLGLHAAHVLRGGPGVASGRADAALDRFRRTEHLLRGAVRRFRHGRRAADAVSSPRQPGWGERPGAVSAGAFGPAC